MKKILIVMGLIFAMAVPLTAFAATSDAPAAQSIRGFCGLDVSTLTDQQTSDLKAQFDKMTDLKIETVNKMVANGAITEEQGKAAIERINEINKNCQENGFTNGMRRNGHGGQGRRANCGSCTEISE